MNPIFPRRCHLCDSSLNGEERFICTRCAAGLPRTLYHRYWLNTNAPNADLNPMEERFAGLVPFSHATAPFFYSRDSRMQQLVHDFKYRKFPGLACELGRLGARELMPTGFFSGIDLILPVPLHWIRRWRRGYNQCEHIAFGASEVTGIPVRGNLKAARSHRTQTHLSRERRQANTRGVFKVKDAAELEGKHLLIIDDICTTGSTLLSAALTVSEACPAAKISMMTLAVVY